MVPNQLHMSCILCKLVFDPLFYTIKIFVKSRLGISLTTSVRTYGNNATKLEVDRTDFRIYRKRLPFRRTM